MKRFEIRKSVTKDAVCMYELYERTPTFLIPTMLNCALIATNEDEEKIKACIEHLGGQSEVKTIAEIQASFIAKPAIGEE